MKKILAAMFLLLLFSNATAIVYKISSHEINIEVDTQGFVNVSERYFLVFPNRTQADEFTQVKNTSLQFNLAKWKEFDPELKINFGQEADISNLLVDFADEPSGELLYYVEFSYSLNSPSFNAMGEYTARKVYFEINRTAINSLIHRTDYVIPAGTTLTFILPPRSEPTGQILNNPKIMVMEDDSARKRIVMPGYLASSDFDFGFTYFKDLAPSFSIALLVKDFSENTTRETQLALGFVLIVILIVLYISRNRIEKRTTGFIIANTDLAHGGEEK